MEPDRRHTGNRRVPWPGSRVPGGLALLLLAGAFVACGGWSGSSGSAPRIIAVSPDNGATGVGIMRSIQVRFDRAMDNACFDNTTFFLDASGIVGTVTYADNVASLRAANLARGMTYRVRITTSVRDAGGQRLASPYEWTFTTATDNIWENSKSLATASDDQGTAVATDGADVYVAGSTAGAIAGTGAGGLDVFVAKFGPTGGNLWTRQFGSADNDIVQGIAYDANGFVHAAGYGYGAFDNNTRIGGADAFLATYDDNGVKIRSLLFGTPDDDFAHAVAVDGTGRIFVAGGTFGVIDNTGASFGGEDMFVAMADASGVAWARQIGGPSSDIGRAVVAAPGGGAFAVGSTGIDNASEILLAGYDAAGTQTLSRQFGSSAGDVPTGIAVDATGDLYITGFTYGAFGTGALGAPARNQGSTDVFVVKCSASGTVLWQHSEPYSTAGIDMALGTPALSGGTLYVAGTTDGTLGTGEVGSPVPGGRKDLFLLAVRTSDGAVLWKKQIGTSGDDVGTGAAADSVGNAFVAGYTSGNLDGMGARGGTDAFLMKYRSDGVLQ